MNHPRGFNISVQDYLTNLVTGKTVLDVGCVEHSAATQEQLDTFLHKNLRRSASRVVGLDFNEQGVAELNRRGYEVVCGDAMTVDVGERFDIVIAGEIIEHVENPGGLIRNLKKHLKPGGLLVVTTPNPFYVLHFAEMLFLSAPHKGWNDEHVAWFCYFTLDNLLVRCGMKVEECWYFTRSRKARRILQAVHIRCPRVAASSFLIIATENGNP
jgi:2-polyprenyl-3-methyl-5-hydroxy-6-metoxy-1,4-benzoquinol methylase